MIASLRGPLLEKSADSVVIEAGGVGYLVTVTAAALRALPATGAEARLFIYSHSTQDGGMQLFGFADAEERRVFEALIGVQGVGPKVGIAILSGVTTDDLVRAISGGDLGRLKQIRGVGPKLAERLAVELRDKIGAVARAGARGGAALPAIIPAGRLGEVHGALLALGYKPPEFEAVLPTLDVALPTPDLIKLALAALRRR